MTIKDQKGFTLVELLVVIAIIAVLGIVAIAAINPAAKIAAAKDAQAIANVQQISKAFEACLADRVVAGDTQSKAVDNCCGLNAAGACVPNQTTVANCAAGTSLTSCGLSPLGYGFASGWPSGIAVNRAAAGALTVCVSQGRASDTNYDKYITGGGTVNIAAGGVCASGV